MKVTSRLFFNAGKSPEYVLKQRFSTGGTPTDPRGYAKNLNPLKICTFWAFFGLFYLN